jgi:hypothetical protein
MIQITDQQLQENYNSLCEYIEKYISSPRKEKLLALYKEKEEIIMFAPASGKEHYHSCYIGGYVAHVLNVIQCGIELDKVWKKQGAQESYTDEELIFALLNHDLGKLGEGSQPYYVPNPSEWHRKNQGAIYAHNPKINFMPVPDRSLFILQEAGIDCTFNEYVAIKIHDGLYDEGNKAYYVSYSDDGKLRTQLPFIVHQADFMASNIEYQTWKLNKEDSTQHKPVKGNTKVAGQMNALASSNAKNIFDDLFKTS